MTYEPPTPAAMTTPAPDPVPPRRPRRAGPVWVIPAAAIVAPPGPELSAADVKLTPKVAEKQCFGSAGCNVTVKVQMSYAGPTLKSSRTKITAKVTGVERVG
ncbi:hypothetical protein ACFY36_31675 [Actinoplanes sp. NPDC000266]